MKGFRVFSLLFVFLVFFGCKKDRIEPIQKNVLGMKFQIIPLKEKTKESKDGEYYLLKLSYADGSGKDVIGYGTNGDPNMYSANLRYLSFELQKDIQIKVGEDEYPCTYYNFERTYGLSPYASALIAFDTKKKKGKKRILIDIEALNAGEISFPVN